MCAGHGSVVMSMEAPCKFLVARTAKRKQRGVQDTLTHAVVFDEAHKASRLQLIPTMAKECRKFGISFVVSSQAATDFDTELYAAVANYLVLRVNEVNAKALAKNVAGAGDAKRVADDLKKLEKYQGWFFSEGQRPAKTGLLPPLEPEAVAGTANTVQG